MIFKYYSNIWHLNNNHLQKLVHVRLHIIYLGKEKIGIILLNKSHD
jgi:hypothetical protein